MAKSKFFRVAVEGATTDGRNIEARWIRDIAETYNPQTYGARVFAEHIRGLTPDGPFQAYGDVTAVKAEPVPDGPLKGKLALYAQIDPTPAMLALTTSRQKIYSSIEVTPKFGATGKAYLAGLGITDSPASLGTDMLQFSASAKVNPLASRKQAPDNLFSAADDEVTIEWEDEPSDSAFATLFKNLKDRLAKISQSSVSVQDFSRMHEAFGDVITVIEQHAEKANAVTQTFAERFGALERRLDNVDAATRKVGTEFADLHHRLSTTRHSAPRQIVTGHDNVKETNC